jgi:hypothetical protein
MVDTQAMTSEEYMALEREMAKQKLENLGETVTCKVCKQPHHLVTVNDRVAFYVHHGDELKTCTALGYRTSYLGDYADMIKERLRILNDRAKAE